MPSYVNAGTRANSSGATTRNPELPGSRSNGNLLIAVCGSKNNYVHTCNDETWSKYDQQNSGGSWTGSLWYRIVDGSEASPTITVGSSNVACFAQIIQISGPFDPSIFGASNVNTGSGSTHSCNGVNTTRDNSLMLYVDTAAANTALAQPSGWTENLDNGSSTGATRNANGSKSVATSGTASGNISVTGANAAWVMWQIELRVPEGYVEFQCAAEEDTATSEPGNEDLDPFNNDRLYLYYTGGDKNYIGCRWQINIPAGATILSAYVQFNAAMDDGTNANGRFRVGGWDVDSCDAFNNSHTHEIPNHHTPSGTYSANATPGTGTGWKTSADISQILQEFIDRPGYVAGSSYFGCFIDPNVASVYFRVYNGNTGANAPKLIVVYEEAGGNEYTLSAENGSFSLSGIATSVKADRLLSASSASLTVTGNSAGLNKGFRLGMDVGSFSLTGNGATFARTYRAACATASFVLTGSASSLKCGRKIQAAEGSFSLTGIGAVLRKGYRFGVEEGVFTLAGINAGFARTYRLSSDPAGYALSGFASGLRVGRKIAAGNSTFSLAGNPAAFLRGFGIVVGPGAFSLSGWDAGLIRSVLLSCNHGVFTIAGQGSSLLIARYMGASKGEFTLAGIDVTFVHEEPGSYTLLVDPGIFGLTGGLTQLLADRVLSASNGSHVLHGIDVTFRKGYGFNANAGAFSLAGFSAGLLAGRKLFLQHGQVTLSAEDVSLLCGRALAGQAGVLALTGTDAHLLAARLLGLDPGSFMLAGVEVALVHGNGFLGTIYLRTKDFSASELRGNLRTANLSLVMSASELSEGNLAASKLQSSSLRSSTITTKEFRT